MIWLFLLGSVVVFLVTFIFIGSCFLVIVSHFETKDLPFGRFTTFRFALFQIMCFLTIFFTLLFLLPLPNILPKIGFSISPKIGAPIDARSPKGIVPPLCLLFGALLYLPPIYQTPFFTDCLPLTLFKKYTFFYKK